MPDLFIANCSRQPQVVCYRIDFDEKGSKNTWKPPTQRDIGPGQQITAARGLHIDALNHIEEQLRVYGMCSVSELGRLPARPVPVVFNIDKPVPRKMIEDVMAHNEQVKTLEGKTRRQKAAVASNDIVTKTVEQELLRQQAPAELMPDLNESSVEYEQVDTTAEDQVRLEEGIRIRADAPSPEPPRQKRAYNRKPK